MLYPKMLLFFIYFLTSIPFYGQKIIKSPNHYQVTIPKNWNELDNNKVDEILKAREEQSGIKDVLTEFIIVKSEEFSVPNIQFLFNRMKLSDMKFSEFIDLFNKIVPMSQKYVLNNTKISDKILKSSPSKSYVDHQRKMFLYHLNQEVAGSIGPVIITSANFMANHGIVTLNFTTKVSEHLTYIDTFLNIINTLKVDTRYTHK